MKMKMEIEAKDTKRVVDIVAKAKGDRNKELQLATNMAMAITKADKAYRRARAAEAENFHSIAAVFFVRYRSLIA